MKKQVKKLNLSKETLRGLESFDLKGPAGGVVILFNSCACSRGFGCQNTDTTCGTAAC